MSSIKDNLVQIREKLDTEKTQPSGGGVLEEVKKIRQVLDTDNVYPDGGGLTEEICAIRELVEDGKGGGSAPEEDIVLWDGTFTVISDGEFLNYADGTRTSECIMPNNLDYITAFVDDVEYVLPRYEYEYEGQPVFIGYGYYIWSIPSDYDGYWDCDGTKGPIVVDTYDDGRWYINGPVFIENRTLTDGDHNIRIVGHVSLQPIYDTINSSIEGDGSDYVYKNAFLTKNISVQAIENARHLRQVWFKIFISNTITIKPHFLIPNVSYDSTNKGLLKLYYSDSQLPKTNPGLSIPINVPITIFNGSSGSMTINTEQTTVPSEYYTVQPMTYVNDRLAILLTIKESYFDYYEALSVTDKNNQNFVLGPTS